MLIGGRALSQGTPFVLRYHHTMTPTLSSTELPPISDPVVTVNGRTLTVAYTFMAEYKLSEWGVDVQKAWQTMLPSSDDPRRVFYVCNLFAAMVAHNYGVGEKAPTAEDWIRMFGSDPTLVNLTMQAVTQALGKLLQAKPKETNAAAQPAMTQIPAPSTSGVN